MKLALVVTAAAAALAMAGCQQKDEAATAADPGTSNPAVNAAQDATGAAVGSMAAATVAQTTEGFVTNAAISDMYEIQAGQIAQQKGQAAGVKAFGKMMVEHHTAMTNQMKPLVSAAGFSPPAGLDERRKGMIDNLNAAPAASFDAVYLAQQEAAHREALTLMQGYAADGADAGLKGGAAKAVPKVQQHLDQVMKLKGGG